jgi:4-alpha-glucanotransferase
MPQMSDDLQALAALAEKCGIESGFYDISGHYRETSAETKRVLLAAMGVPAQCNSQVTASLDGLERDEWTEGLPPVVVAYTGRPLAVEVVLRENPGDLTWKLSLETGDLRSDKFSFMDLTLVKERTDGAKKLQKRILKLPSDVPSGYHAFEIDPGGYQMSLIVTPGRCWLPLDVAKGRKLWGLAAQLYLLRSKANWGIGDFSDLRMFLEIASANGAHLVGINPIHSMFLTHPEQASPYSPSHRSLLNILYIDVTAIPEFANCEQARDLMETAGFARELADYRGAHHVEYGKVAGLKLRVLRLLFAHWQSTGAQRRQSFEKFRQSRGEYLERACIFEALAEQFQKSQPSTPQWRNWPSPFQSPASSEVRQFAITHEKEVEFYMWMQWVADEQLKQAVAAGRDMPIGLYGDLAVGSHPDGAEAWSNQNLLAAGVSIGAPPDPFSWEGQNWGLPPYNPRALRHGRYAAFIDLIRANMRHRGALRVDHAMALQRLYWVPQAHSPIDGAYVRYPLDDLLGILSLESHRNRCLIIAEDLGTVPEEFRRKIAEADILSYRVLLFERAAGNQGFLPPSNYPKLSIAVAGNHDLPTLRAWWEAADLELKTQIGMIRNTEELERERRQREQDRRQLLEALRAEGLVSLDGEIGWVELIPAVHSYLSRTGSILAVAQLDDITGETEPVNIPGTVDQYGNWRRRLSISLEQIANDPRFVAIKHAFSGRSGK